jgi:hypothetical protein
MIDASLYHKLGAATEIYSHKASNRELMPALKNNRSELEFLLSVKFLFLLSNHAHVAS